MARPKQNNPAKRLHRILSRAQDLVTSPNTGGEAGKLWAGVFEIAPPTAPTSGPIIKEVISRILQLDQLIADTEESLRRIDGLPEKYFRPFARIRNIPEQSLVALNADIRGTIRAITAVDMTILDFCSDKLEEQHLERVVDEGELAQILEDVNALFNDVQQSSLDAELKTFVLDNLESIRRGIYEFRIRGPLRLQETMAEIIGNLAVNHDVIKAARDQDENIVKRFETAFYRLAAVVSFAVDGPALLSAVKTVLLPGGG